MNAPLPIGQTLIAAGLIGEDQLRIALHEQRGRSQPLGRVLVERHQNSIRSSATKLMFQVEFVGFSRLSLGNDPLQSLKDQIPRYRGLRDGTDSVASRFSNYD